MANFKKRLTGADLDTNSRWQIAGTDLGIPYILENGSIGYLFGDTFTTAWPEGPPPPPANGWRAPVMLRSNIHPGSPGGIVFELGCQGLGRRIRTRDFGFQRPESSPGWSLANR